MKTNIKLRVTPEQSEAVQKICFANGIFFSGEKDKISYLEAKYLFIESDKIWYRNFTDHNIGFETKGYTEVDADLFIRTNGTCEEPVELVDNLSNSKSKEDMFKQYGFQVPNFECELLGVVSSPYEKNQFVVGVIKKGIFNNCPHMWDIKYGTCYTSSIASNMYDYNLTPIKKPWYETCKFPVLLNDEGNNLFVLHTLDNFTTDMLDTFKPLSNAEIDQLKQDF